MRVSSSQHEGSPRRSFRLGPETFLELNSAVLLCLLRNNTAHVPQLIAKCKKRARSPSPTGLAVAKRVKTDSGAYESVIRGVEVHQHAFEIRYRVGDVFDPSSTHTNPDEDIVIAGENEHSEKIPAPGEAELIAWVRDNCENLTQPSEFVLGELYLQRWSSRCFLGTIPAFPVSNTSPEKSTIPRLPSQSYLLAIPLLQNDAEDEQGLSISHDLISAWTTLAEHGRIRVSATARLVVPPFTANTSKKQGDFLISLHVDCKVELLFPPTETPASCTTKAKILLLENSQHSLLNHVFPQTSHLDVCHSAPDIPFFYSVLGPAPPLCSRAADEAAQPADLLPTLLPFQRRSVGWLLEREGKTISSTGKVVPKVHNDATLPLFWEKIQLPEGSALYLNRATAAVSLERPSEEVVLGGILAEEPGLGKTLEAISLVLLNPAIGRNPATKRWDPQAKVFVKEIKTTLIVTPASLATQWADEFRLHAPTLKVLVYDGWTNVSVPITEEDAEEAREHRQEAETKAKGKGKASVPVRAKTIRQKVRPSVKGPSSSTPTGRESNDAMDVGENAKDEDEEEEILDWCAYVNTFDVCITTYNVLQQDLGVARAPPTRPRRDTAQYSNVERPRSPLVMCEWYRVVMDEVQMVGGGKTAEMVSLIPRLSSLAVSGTPARTHVADLLHVFKFLRVDSVSNAPHTWNRLLLPGFSNQFKELLRRYAIRTMKASVKEELTIPQQMRYLVPVEMGRVERQVYDEMLERALNELGLDARGIAASEGWEIDVSLLRSWLRKLRGITTHPQVGQLLHPADKLNKPGILKSIHEVLEGMCDQNWRNLMDDRKKKVELLARSAQLQQHDQRDPRRYQRALEILLQAEKEANPLIDDLRGTITRHDLRGEELKQDAAALRKARGHSVDSSADVSKGKSREQSEDLRDVDDGESADLEDAKLGGLPRTQAGTEHATKRRAVVQRLRECNLTLHKVKFLQGDVYHVLGVAYSATEDAAYHAAEGLRRDLLKYTEAAALRAMSHLKREYASKDASEEELLVLLPYCDQGGIRSADMMEEANEIIEKLLNPQTALLWEWRRRIYDLLTEKMTADGEDATGQEYAKSLETQGEAEVLLQGYAALMADRREVLVAERTTLAAQNDVRAQPKGRKTKAAGKAQAALKAMLLESPDVVEEISTLVPLEPEHQVLAKELADKRRSLMAEFDGRAVRSVMVQLSEVLVRITSDKDPEKELVKEGVHRLRVLINNQNSLMDKLENDLAQLRRAFNERILYFRQLQEISDSVVDAEWEGELALAMQEAVLEQSTLDVRINSNRARQRYLENLAQGKQAADGDDDAEDDEDVCILCQCEFTRGYLTQCAHAFCEGCMKAFLGRRDGKACPVCRVAINVDQLQRFSVQDQPAQQAPPRIISADGEVMPKSRRQIEYNFIAPDVLSDIQSMEVYGSYGRKIETIVRHLLHIQLKDPGAKSIIFSAWADSLMIIQHALVSNGIPCLRIDQGSRGKVNAAKKFRTDPGILVLLLHGERENAGLNVTCASRVFLVESVVNHSFETQAIARVDRMGQKRPTEVYCYYAEDTVERNILDLAARQGLSIYTTDSSAGTLTTTLSGSQPALDSPSKKSKGVKQKGDFIFSTDDMLAILFPHMYEELEYLLPDESNSQRCPIPRLIANAEAGPSRLAAL